MVAFNNKLGLLEEDIIRRLPGEIGAVIL